MGFPPRNPVKKSLQMLGFFKVSRGIKDLAKAMSQLPPEVLLPILQRIGYRGFARTILIRQLKEFSEEYLPTRLERLASYRQSEQHELPQLAAGDAFKDGEFDISDDIIKDKPEILNWMLWDAVLSKNIDELNYVLSRNQQYHTLTKYKLNESLIESLHYARNMTVALLDAGADAVNAALIFEARRGDVGGIKLFMSRGAVVIGTAYMEAAEGEAKEYLNAFVARLEGNDTVVLLTERYYISPEEALDIAYKARLHDNFLDIAFEIAESRKLERRF